MNICTKCDLEATAECFGICEICTESVYMCNLCMPQIETKYYSYEEQIIELHKNLNHLSIDLV